MRMWMRAISVGALGLAAGGVVGCAEERPPILRTQPNQMPKSFFVGEDFVKSDDDPSFYARVVVADVGYGAATDGLFTSTYAQNPTVIKWEITETLLLGRIVYNRIENADGKGDGPTSIDGQLAYAFPILSHFDIRRDYNPATGEEGNVIVENTFDRAWDQRTHMRVDWSRNLNTDAYDFDTLSLLGIFGGVTYEPLAYYVNDPEHPDAPEFALDEGYFDITTKALATPGMIDLSHLGWGIDHFPACFLPNDILGGSWPFGNCNPNELTLRMAFRRVEQTDYEPWDINGRQFAQFGIFYGERFGYARNYGIVDDQWHRFAARYNVWEKHHAYQESSGGGCAEGWVASEDFPGQCELPCYVPEKTPVGEESNRDCGNTLGACGEGANTPNGTADECEAAGSGSQCDKFEQKCTLPYRERTQKPVVWHFTKGSNPDYFDSTYAATAEWDVAMRVAVQTAKYGECMNEELLKGTDIPTAQGTCFASFPVYYGQQEENEDVANLSHEVDECRAGIGAWGEENGGSAPWSEERLSYCNGQADTIGAARGYSAGVIAIAKMDEMITLCHSPVEATDNPICVADHQRLKSEKGRANDRRAVLPDGITAAACDKAWTDQYDSPGDLDETVLEACNNGFVARLGDLRFHQVNVIKTPQTPSPWGIMVDADDPRTGEKIHASINVWSHVNDLAAQGHVDIMRYIAGELSTEEVTDGTYVRDWSAAAEAGSGKGALGTSTREDVTRRNAAVFDGRNFENGQARFEEMPEITDELKQLHKKVLKQTGLAQVRADGNVKSVNRPFVEARRMAAMDTTTEATLITPAMMQLAGMNQGAIDAGQSSMAVGNGINADAAMSSILRTLNPTINRELRHAREMALAERGSCILEADSLASPSPNTFAALTDVMERKFGAWGVGSENDQLERSKRMQDYLSKKYNFNVILHEMGHSIGHRHNFVSSYFAYGFRPQYWQLRTNDGKTDGVCNDVSPDGEDCVGPRYLDPPTDAEKSNLIYMWQQSSVMDYAGEVTQDFLGLGAYDFAATQMFYGHTVAVLQGEDNLVGERNSDTLLNVSDTFGGIVGYQYVRNGGNTIHYTKLQDEMGLITDCDVVDPAAFKPKNWNEERFGVWDTLVDGLIVSPDGTTPTRCKSIPVDYVPQNTLRAPTTGFDGSEDENAGFNGGGPAIDRAGRIRNPYGFATDGWADLGNLSVYRHDNGADPYELFNFLITEQEVRHIFDNYRRNRTSFSVRTQSGRILGRYNEKMRDGAKGLGLFANIYREVLLLNGLDFDAGAGAGIFNLFFPENVLASGIAFDHFTRQFQRPQSGEHQIGCKFGGNACTVIEEDRILRSTTDYNGAETGMNVTIFDGATGLFGMVAPGGKFVENRLADGFGEFDRDYTINAGSYYDKSYAPYLLTESVDNFISDSLGDFTDPRYRAVSMADLFPDGYRRFLANNLTMDEWVKGARVASTGGANPEPAVDSEMFPMSGIGWTTWWTPNVTSCFPAENQIACAQYGCPEGSVCEASGQTLLPVNVVALDNPNAPTNVLAVDSQANWEQWTMLIAQTLMYLPENQKRNWINMMGLWEIGADDDPGFENRIELHIPNGPTYVARTYGTEVIHGRTVQRGIAARVLEYANKLVNEAYDTTPVVTPNATWYEPIVENGKVKVKFDPNISGAGANPTCSAADNSGCTCSANYSCVQLQDYESLPAFIRQAMHDFRMADASMKGIYD
jgi:hypothetical protein